MPRSNSEFFSPHQVKGSPVSSRFSLRKETKTKKPKAVTQDGNILMYDTPGRGANGESSN